MIQESAAHPLVVATSAGGDEVRCALKPAGWPSRDRLPPSLCLEALAAAAACLERTGGLYLARGIGLEGSVRELHQAEVRASRAPGCVRAVLVTQGNPAVSAELFLAEARPLAPRLQDFETWSLERRQPSYNAGALYGELEDSPEALRVVRWAHLIELGHLVGAMSCAEFAWPTDGSAASLQSAPPVIEGLIQMSQWLWYALAGQKGALRGIDEARWYRLPHKDELIVCHVRARGRVRGLASFDATAFGDDRQPLVELKGLCLLPEAGASDGLRLGWQRFLRALGAADR